MPKPLTPVLPASARASMEKPTPASPSEASAAQRALNEEFDALLASMQTPEAQAALARAFDATPDELGRAAVAAARRKKSG